MGVFSVVVNGVRLQQARLKKAWTQAQLAEKSGIAKRTVERMEAVDENKRRVSLATIALVAAALGIDRNELLAETIKSAESAGPIPPANSSSPPLYQFVVSTSDPVIAAAIEGIRSNILGAFQEVLGKVREIKIAQASNGKVDITIGLSSAASRHFIAAHDQGLFSSLDIGGIVELDEVIYAESTEAESASEQEGADSLIVYEGGSYDEKVLFGHVGELQHDRVQVVTDLRAMARFILQRSLETDSAIDRVYAKSRYVGPALLQTIRTLQPVSPDLPSGHEQAPDDTRFPRRIGRIARTSSPSWGWSGADHNALMLGQAGIKAILQAFDDLGCFIASGEFSCNLVPIKFYDDTIEQVVFSLRGNDGKHLRRSTRLAGLLPIRLFASRAARP